MAQGLQIRNRRGEVVIDTSRSTWNVLTTALRGGHTNDSPLNILGVSDVTYTLDANNSVVSAVSGPKEVLLVRGNPRSAGLDGTVYEDVVYYQERVEVGSVTKATTASGEVSYVNNGIFVDSQIGRGPPLVYDCGGGYDTFARGAATFNFDTNEVRRDSYLSCDNINAVSWTRHSSQLVYDPQVYRGYRLSPEEISFSVPGWERCSEVIVTVNNVGISDPSSQEAHLYEYTYSNGLLSTYGGNIATLFIVLGR